MLADVHDQFRDDAALLKIVGAEKEGGVEGSDLMNFKTLGSGSVDGMWRKLFVKFSVEK